MTTQLQPWTTIQMDYRKNVLSLMSILTKNLYIARELESLIHTSTGCLEEYTDKSQQIAYNLKNGGAIRNVLDTIQDQKEIHSKCKECIFMTDSVMCQGTVVSDIERETIARRERFEQMLAAKYDAIGKPVSSSSAGILRCRRCGSTEINWEQKQTRSADEASTVFCSCSKCKMRWTMR